MFEEVPRERTGWAGLTARRIVLGPFAIGGGLALATIGGSVAVAATVFTASTIGVNDAPPRHVAEPVAVSSSEHHSTSPTHNAGSAPVTRTRSTPTATTVTRSTTTPSRETPTPTPTSSRPAAPTATTRNPQAPIAGSPSGVTSSAGPTPTGSISGPAGNAVIYLNGWDATTKQVRYQFATTRTGAGPGGTDLHTVSSQQQFSAGLADGITVTSAGTLCGPAGSHCTVDQLIAAAGTGFFATVAIDHDAKLRSVIELADAAPQPASSVAPTPSASVSPALTPSSSGTS